MKLREVPILLLVPLGFGAALSAHAVLAASAGLGFGASEFTSHTHAAVEPITFVEIALALWMFGCTVRDALTARALPHYALSSRPRLGIRCLPIWAGCVGAIAVATLFGMEYAESGSAALGLGWLGGALVPGVSALVCGIGSAVGLLYLALAGHLAGFDHLVALFAAALARSIATLLAPVRSQLTLSTRRVKIPTAPVARHAGLRAPPLAAP